MTKKQKKNWLYKTLLRRLPVDARPRLKEEWDHFEPRVADESMPYTACLVSEADDAALSRILGHDTTAAMLMCAFPWDFSKYGFEYWASVRQRLDASQARKNKRHHADMACY